MTREALKQTITDYAKAHQQTFITISQQIHARPELGNEEVYASARLSEQLEREGFSVQRNIAGHSTGFIAKKSSEKPGPTVYFLAEYDALPEIGHACGHNIIGTTSVLAAILLGQIIEEIGGTVAVAGTPAEEGGDNGSAKASFVNRGYFDDGDAAIMIHPGKETRVSGHSLAVDPVDYHFHGRTAHASATPEKGINALDSVIQLFNGINALREHLADDIRIHGVIPDGGKAPNVVPDYARARFFLRAASRHDLNEVRKKVDRIAEGAGFMSGADLEITEFQNAIDELLPNDPFNELFYDIFTELGHDVEKTPSQAAGSTDTGNVSQVLPTIHPHIKIGDNLVGHTREFAEAASSPKGDQAVIDGGVGLALIGLELFLDSERLVNIKRAFEASRSKQSEPLSI